MFSVYADGQLIYAPAVLELSALDPDLSLAVNQAGSFSITLPASHPYYAQMERLKTIIEVYKFNRRVFRGRILDDEYDFWNNRKFYCEGDLAYFNDTVLRPYSFEGSVADYLQLILDQHNAQVATDRQFTVGTVTVTDPNDFIVRADTTYPQTWEIIKAKLINSLGGYMATRHVSGITYLDYLADSDYRSLQVIRVDQNLLDVLRHRSGDDIGTVIIPLGARDPETGNRLTIEDVNAGHDYLVDTAGVARHGWIWRTVEWDDVTIASNLKTKATAKLAEMVQTISTIELKAADLAMAGADIDDFNLFEYVEVSSPKHELTDLYLVKAIRQRLDQPGQDVLTIGKQFGSLTDKQMQSSNVIRKINADYVTNDKVSSIRDNLTTLSSTIEQTADSIRTEVSEQYVSTGALDEYRSEISTQFQQTSDSFSFNFSTIEELITQLDGYTEVQFAEIKRFIRFVEGVIQLGADNSQYAVEISNERMSFLDGGAEVAYMTGQTLFVSHAVIERLQAANHVFIKIGTEFTALQHVGG